MRFLIGILLSLWSSIALAAPHGVLAAYAPYDQMLQKTCPDKRLYYLSPAALNDLLMIDFPRILPRNQRARMAQADRSKQDCVTVSMGASCQNMSMLRTAHRTGLLPRFVRMICSKTPACRGQSDCG